MTKFYQIRENDPMKTSTLIVMTILVVLGVATLMMINYSPSFNIESNGIPPVEIKTMTIVHHGEPVILSLEQLKVAKNAFANALKVKKSDYEKEPLNFDKIIIAKYSGPDLEIIPVRYVGKDLIFEVPSVSTDTYFLEHTDGNLQKMINHSFDEHKKVNTGQDL